VKNDVNVLLNKTWKCHGSGILASTLIYDQEDLITLLSHQSDHALPQSFEPCPCDFENEEKNEEERYIN
jgi:hypothetical protein